MKKRQFLKINTIEELGYQLGLPGAFLIRTAGHIKHCYKKFTDIDKKGKERTFYKVNNDLKKIHRKINKLLDTLDYPVNIQGGIVGRSIHTNASIHAHKKYVANFDIKNFFPSVRFKTVYRAFRMQNCTPDVSRMLTRFTTADAELPQGFATSPKASGLVLLNVNRRLTILFKKYGLAHTFWIDDLTISGHRPIQKFQKLINKIFRQERFTLHDDPKKTKFTSSKERQTCTGLVINQEPNAEKSIREKVRKELYLCTKFGVVNYLKEHDLQVDKEKYLMSLRGKISFLTAANKKNMVFREHFEKLKV
jgi:hypothetical protein